MATIQGVYLALFGRPADPAGLAYFNDLTNNGTNLAAISNLSGQQEYLSRFNGLTNEQIVNVIYQALFGRDAEPAGLSFYVGQLAAGKLSINTIAINILDGAAGNDKANVDAKIAAANLFTNSLDTPAEIAAYNGDAAAALARTYINGINASNPGTEAGVNAAIQSVVTSGGQAPGGGDDGGDGGDDGSVDPPVSPITYKINAAVTPTKVDGSLLTGTGNPNTGFAVTSNSSEGIEVGLSARYRYGETKTNGVAGADHIVKFDKIDPENFAIAYSVSDSGNIDLANNTYKLILDTDPTVATSVNTTQTFILTQHGNSFVWVLDIDKDGELQPFEHSSPYRITDDAQTLSATQNIQPMAEYMKKAGTYDVQLIASDTATQSTLAESHIQIITNVTRDVSDDVAKADTGYLYAGRGNSAEKFATAESEGIELGLGAKISGGASVEGTVGQPSVSPNDGLVHFEVNNASNLARFQYSISAEEKLSDYKFVLKIDTDGGVGTVWKELTLVAASTGEHNDDPRNTGQSIYVWKDGTNLAFADDGGDASTGKVTQNIQSLNWGGLTDGRYDVVLEAYSASDNTLIVSNHVVYDIVGSSPVIP